MRKHLQSLSTPRWLHNTLNNKIALGLILVISSATIAVLLVTEYWVKSYNDEITQKLNADVAMYIEQNYDLIDDSTQEINHSEFQKLAHQTMVINPMAHVYLLAPNGQVIDYSSSLSDQQLTQTKVPLGPIHQFLNTPSTLPIYANDPQAPKTKQVFSAAALYSNNEIVGYLYIVLASNIHKDFSSMLDKSYSAGMLLTSIGFIGFAAVITGLLISSLILKRLNNLSRSVCRFTSEISKEHQNCDKAVKNYREGDEIDLLNQTFTQMSEKISQQINLLTEADNQRRELISNVSHDLRTPLASTRGYLETLLIKDSLSKEEQAKHLRQAIASSNRLADLISELFELAKLEAPTTHANFEIFSLTELVYDTLQEFALELEQREISWSVTTHQNILVEADISLMQRVFENLIRNAVAYTPQHGEVIFDLDTDSEELNFVKVRIKDNGAGIAEEDLPYIFERYYANPDRSRKGTESSGIGLAIVKRIMELHNTEIGVKSTLGEGTTFEFRLPIGC